MKAKARLLGANTWPWFLYHENQTSGVSLKLISQSWCGEIEGLSVKCCVEYLCWSSKYRCNTLSEVNYWMFFLDGYIIFPLYFIKHFKHKRAGEVNFLKWCLSTLEIHKNNKIYSFLPSLPCPALTCDKYVTNPNIEGHVKCWKVNTSIFILLNIQNITKCYTQESQIQSHLFHFTYQVFCTMYDLYKKCVSNFKRKEILHQFKPKLNSPNNLWCIYRDTRFIWNSFSSSGDEQYAWPAMTSPLYVHSIHFVQSTQQKPALTRMVLPSPLVWKMTKRCVHYSPNVV
jgi:hypothetical protein